MINIYNQTAGSGRMRLTKAKGFMLASLVAGAMVLPLLLPVQRAQADSENSQRGGDSDALLGTWSVQVSVDPGTVPPGSLLNFSLIVTFDAGGGFVASNNGPGAGGPPGQGNWAKTGRHQYALTQLRFGFDAAHNFTGLNRIRTILTLNKRGDEYTDISQADIFLPNGTLLPFHPGTTSHGTRVAIEPLN